MADTMISVRVEFRWFFYVHRVRLSEIICLIKWISDRGGLKRANCGRLEYSFFYVSLILNYEG